MCPKRCSLTRYKFEIDYNMRQKIWDSKFQVSLNYIKKRNANVYFDHNQFVLTNL